MMAKVLWPVTGMFFLNHLQQQQLRRLNSNYNSSKKHNIYKRLGRSILKLWLQTPVSTTVSFTLALSCTQNSPSLSGFN